MPATPFIGQVIPVPYNFAPQGWAFCNGQLLAISQNTALFSLLGTQFGGDGRSTFGLPNLQGSVAINAGQGTRPEQLRDRPDWRLRFGFADIEPVARSFPWRARLRPGGRQQFAGGSRLGDSSERHPLWSDNVARRRCRQRRSRPQAASQPHENRQPYLVLNYIIALQGVFPSRSLARPAPENSWSLRPHPLRERGCLSPSAATSRSLSRPG